MIRIANAVLRVSALSISTKALNNKGEREYEREQERVHKREGERASGGLQQQDLVPVAMVTPVEPSKGISWITCLTCP